MTFDASRNTALSMTPQSCPPTALSRPGQIQRHCLAAFILPVAIALTFGCVSSDFKRVEGPGSPPVAFNLSVEKPPLEATLHTVIWWHGPGSWKRDAWWGEYVFSVKNIGNQPLVPNAAGCT